MLSLRLLLTLSITAWFAWSTYLALPWRMEARLLPLVLGIPALVLCLVQLVKDVRGAGRTVAVSARDTMDVPVDDDMTTAVLLRRVGRAFLWFLGLIAVIWFVGMRISLPLFVVLYVWIEAKEKWWRAALYGVIFAAALTLMIDLVFRTRVYEGLLGEFFISLVRGY